MSKTKGSKKNKSEFFKPLQSFDQETAEFFKKFCDKFSFQDEKWFKDVQLINLVDHWQRLQYYPHQMKSAHFKTTCNDNSSVDNSWIQLDVFETHLNPESQTLTGYVGSESYAMEWLPKPTFGTYDGADYLVVSSSVDGFEDYERPNFIQKNAIQRVHKGLIQLWRLKENTFKCVCCFANDHGLIWAFEAPKGGTSYCPIKRRLSLIAAAFDDGFVRIYAIPFPEDLAASHVDAQLPPVYSLPPVAVLPPPFSSHIVARCLSWSWCDQQKYLTVGYGNGIANYYDLSTTSSILIRNDYENNHLIIKPIKTWIAHGALVSAMQILPLPGSKTIITGGWDRNIKLWNIKEARLFPLLILHRSIVHCLTASLHMLGGFFISLDDAFLASNQSVVTFKQIYEEGQRSSVDSRSLYTLPFATSNVYSLSLSPFFNSIIVSDDSGNSILQNNFRAKHEKTTRRKLSDLLPVFTSSIQQLEIKSSGSSVGQRTPAKKAKISSEVNSSTYFIDKNEPRMRSYREITSKYGIIFNDYTVNHIDSDLIHITSKFRDNSNLKRSRLTDYPLTSINKCIWSPNKESANTLANLMHSGFIRITSISKSFIEDEKPQQLVVPKAKKTERSKRIVS